MSRRLLLPGALALLVACASLGAALGDDHVPVPIEPDAPLADGVQVATFALG